PMSERDPQPVRAPEPPIILPGEVEPVEGYGLAASEPPLITQIQAKEPPFPVETVPLAEAPSVGPRPKVGSPAGRKRATAPDNPARPPPAAADDLDEGPPPPPPPRHPLL